MIVALFDGKLRLYGECGSLSHIGFKVTVTHKWMMGIIVLNKPLKEMTANFMHWWAVPDESEALLRTVTPPLL